MHIKFFLFAFLLSVYTDISAQTFFKITGGANLDAAMDVKQTTDNGYIILGSTFSFGGHDENMYITKLNSSGIVIWSKAAGTTANERPVCIQPTSDNGCLAVADNLIIKLSAGGNVQMSGKPSLSTMKTGAVCTLNKGDFAIAGNEGTASANKQLYVARLAANGALMWKRAVNTNLFSNYRAVDIKEAWDGCYYMLVNAQLTSTTSYTILLFKINASGRYIWCRAYKPPVYASNYTWGGLSLMRGSDGKFFINTHLSYSGNNYFMVINTDTSGLPVYAARMPYNVWQAHQFYKQSAVQLIDNYPGFHSSFTSDKGFITTGEYFFNDDFNISICKYDSTGNSCMSAVQEDELNAVTDTVGLYPAALNFPASTGGFISVQVKQYSTGTVNDICSDTQPLKPRQGALAGAAVSNTLLIYPNPVNDEYAVRFTSSKNAEGFIQVINSNGAFIHNEACRIVKGQNKKQFSAAGLLPGYYTLILKCSEITLKASFIKL